MNKDDLRKAMQEAQKLQVDLVKTQAELAHSELKLSSDDGFVAITLNAQGEFKSVKINPEILNSGIKTLEKKILEVLKQANKQSTAAAKNSLDKIIKGLGL
jgi:nucleoid-associated protein EbfC